MFEAVFTDGCGFIEEEFVPPFEIINGIPRCNSSELETFLTHHLKKRPPFSEEVSFDF